MVSLVSKTWTSCLLLSIVLTRLFPHCFLTVAWCTSGNFFYLSRHTQGLFFFVKLIHCVQARARKRCDISLCSLSLCLQEFLISNVGTSELVKHKHFIDLSHLYRWLQKKSMKNVENTESCFLRTLFTAVHCSATSPTLCAILTLTHILTAFKCIIE